MPMSKLRRRRVPSWVYACQGMYSSLSYSICATHDFLLLSRTGARKNSLVSPVEPMPPPRSCLKPTHQEVPPLSPPLSPVPPGGFSHSPPSPVLSRRRSPSSSYPTPFPSNTAPLPSIPTEIIPLRECCPTCNSATELATASGNAYKISWSAGAAAKKKRDDAEERGDILAGLKPMKWGTNLVTSPEEEADDGFAKPIAADDSDDDAITATACPPGSVHAIDPLAKLDGTMHIPKSSSTSSLNKVNPLHSY